MCRFKSGIILKNKVVLTPEKDESHSNLLINLGIEDNYFNSSNKFIRAELFPKDGDKMSDTKEWIYKVDQDVVPIWYEEDSNKYEQEFRDAVEKYMEEWKKKIKIHLRILLDKCD